MALTTFSNCTSNFALSDFTGWESDNDKFEAQFERMVKVLQRVCSQVHSCEANETALPASGFGSRSPAVNAGANPKN